jgi:glycosyltransferase involved in cell wall biosynthesis
MRYGETTVGRARLAAVIQLPRYWWRLARLLRARADVLHAQDLRGLLLAAPAARLACIPVVWHVHAASPHPLLNRFGVLLATRTVLSAEGLQVRGIPARRVAATIPNGVAAPATVRAGSPAGRPRLLTLGRLDPVKGLDTLLEAVAILRSLGTDIEADVLGGEQPGYPDHARHLSARRDALQIADVVAFRGHVEDPAPFLHAASIYVQPSRHDMQPLAVLEAMAAGLPVVATRAGGLPQLLTDGVTGLLVPPDDPAALAAAIQRLIDDPDLAARLGAAGHTRVRAEFSEGATIDRLEALYRDLFGIEP